jgi:tetratricopeptide (TPR) repeat protein
LNRLGNVEQAKEMLAAAVKIGGNSDVLVAQLGELEISEEEGSGEADADEMPQFEGNSEEHREWVEGQIARYEAMLAEHPTWVDARVRYGMLLKLLGRFEDAAAALEIAARENPAYGEAWVQLALARRASGDGAGAMAALEHAVQIKPETAELHYRLGLIYCSDMEFDLAMERVEFAVVTGGEHEDLQRQVWVALKGMAMSGRRRREQGTPDEVAKDMV